MKLREASLRMTVLWVAEDFGKQVFRCAQDDKSWRVGIHIDAMWKVPGPKGPNPALFFRGLKPPAPSELPNRLLTQDYKTADEF